MKCRIREIITTASAVALTVAAAPAATAYAASVDDAQAVISENVGEAVAVTRLATASETTTWNKAVTLTEDTVVDGNLNITANVDLNGYTLTVNGDINHIAGTITCNNGILNINGTYYIGSTTQYAAADLILSEDSDEVNINGSLETYYLKDNHGILQDAGTITVSGDINANSGFIMNTENYTVLVLNGQSDQNVNFGNCPTLNTLKVNDPEKREIIWNGNMNVRHFASDIINVKSVGLKLSNIDLENTTMVVNGNCSIANRVDINGGQLTINGNLYHSVGTIICNNGTLNINGTYYIGSTTQYATADLILSEDSDEVNINGSLETYYLKDNHGILQDAGTITVSGDINANSGFIMNTENYTVLVLNGQSDQNVNFGNCPTLNTLKVNDPEKREIIWNGNMNVRHFASDIINVKSVGLKLSNIDLENTTMVVNGNCSIANRVDINGGQLTINGNLYHSVGTIICNNGTLNINGTYYIGSTTQYATTDLILSEDSDEVNINGSLVTYYISDNHGILQDAGTITVSGDINANSGFIMNTENYTVLVLNGQSDQNVNFGNCPTLNTLKVNDPEKREIIWNGNMNVRHFASDIINVKSVGLKLSNIDLENTTMVVNGNCSIANRVDINGGQLTINGNLYHSVGTIICNNGTLNINGTYYIGSTTQYATTDLILSEDSDEVNINGSLVTYYISDNHGILQDAGTITVSGDINANSGFIMNTENYTVLVLNGQSDQNVNFGNCPTLNTLKVNDPEKREIIWNGNMNVRHFASDIINVKSVGLKLSNIDLENTTMVVNGNCSIANRVDINGGQLTINGNLYHSVGTIICNNGTLNINGTYYIGSTTQYATTDLILSEDSDEVNINGSLVTYYISDNHGILQDAGTITVSGDIDAISGLIMNTDNYTVLKLNGMSKQKITLPKGTKINVLVINKFMSCYEFNQKECWNELITDYPAYYPAVVIKKWEKGNGAVKLTWDAVPGAEKYAIAGYVNGKWTVLNYGYKTSYVLKGLKPGVNYKVAVVAKIGGKWYTDVSKAVVVTPKSVNKYPVVTSEVSGKQFRLNWKAADAAEKYAIAVYQSGKWVVKAQLNGDVTSYTSPKLNNGTYKIVVCAKVNGKWDLSNINSRAINVTIK